MDKHLTIRIPKRGTKIFLVVAIVMAVLAPVAVVAAGGQFTDDDTSVFEADIEWMAATGITFGCNPPANDNYCPTKAVNRGQMAAFMHRLAINKVVDAATAVTADSATTAGHATTADSATTATTADSATTATNADNADALGNKNRWQFQPALFDFEGNADLAVPGNGTFTIATGEVTTTSGFFCLFPATPQADILVRASGYTSGVTGLETATFRLAANGTAITETARQVEGSDGSFAVEWLYVSGGGTDTFTLEANEGGGDIYSVVNAQITVEVLQDTRCEGFVIIFPGIPELTPDDPDLS